VTYDKLGSRVRTVGPMILEYDLLGSRPKRLLVPGREPALPEADLIVLFLVLYERERERKRERSRNS
jgi:hypothetical protein